MFSFVEAAHREVGRDEGVHLKAKIQVHQSGCGDVGVCVCAGLAADFIFLSLFAECWTV